MMDFENYTEYELSEDERAAMMLTLDECLENANDVQLEAIRRYALNIAPIPRAENLDRARFSKLYNSITDVLDGISDGKTSGIVAISAYEALGICHSKEVEARIGLVDYLSNCTTTALQTGNLSNLERMEKVITTIHDLVGDYESRVSYDHLAATNWEDDEDDIDTLF